MIRRGISAALLFLCAVAAVAAEPELRVVPLASPVKVRLRGLSAFSDTVAWASGREGTVLRTIDGGANWSVFHVPGAKALDFRDVQAFGADVALVMGAGPGDASRVYRTADAGRTWTLVLANPDKDGFFDCMDFHGDEGRLLGDPINGRFQVYASSDGGRSWRWTKGPKAQKGEAAFAASGTCLKRTRNGTAIVTGGSQSRALYLPVQLEAKGDWQSLAAHDSVHSASSGLFSVAMRGAGLVAVGGDYKTESAPGLVFDIVLFDYPGLSFPKASGAYYLANHGNEQRLEQVPASTQRGVFLAEPIGFSGSVRGYRSGVACNEEQPEKCVATGPAGSDLLEVRTPTPTAGCPNCGIDPISVEPGANNVWHEIGGVGYDSVSIAANVAWFSGDEGRLGRMQLPAPRE